MKILFVRHGQSEDDLTNTYGGWADFHITQHGIDDITKAAKKIQKLDTQFTKIISSPLLRAKESAAIIADILNIDMEILEYVKEHNTYGLMTGMVKAEAHKKYPWLQEAYENGDYVDGSERFEDLHLRTKKAYELLLKNNTNIIVLTHKTFLKSLLLQLTGKEVIRKDQAGMLMLETTENGVNVLLQDGIELE